MKRTYIIPQTELYTVHTEQSMLLRFSQVDNDGDGKTDQRPIIDGDPDGGIAPGTEFSDIPDDWRCPECGVTKADFVPYEE